MAVDDIRSFCEYTLCPLPSEQIFLTPTLMTGCDDAERNLCMTESEYWEVTHDNTDRVSNFFHE
jgi:hypothetical protein